MRLSTRVPKRIFYAWLVIGLLAASWAIPVWGEEAKAPQTAVAPSEPILSLADVVYQAGTLEQGLSALKSEPEATAKLKILELRLKQADAEVDLLLSRLSLIKDQDLQSYQKLATLIGDVRNEAETVAKVLATSTETIKDVEFQRRHWLSERDRWDRWRTELGADLTIKSVAEAFAKATRDIEGALALTSQKLEPLLAVQQQAGDVHAKIGRLKDQIAAKMLQERGVNLRGRMPSMFSIAYLQQLIDLVFEPARLITAPPLPEATFFKEQGWVVALQGLVFLLLLAVIRRYRSQLLEKKAYRLLGQRPISLSLIVAIFTLSFLYDSPPDLWRVLLQAVAGVVTARLVATFVEDSWIRRSIYVMVLVMIGFQTLLILGAPLSLVRLFILIWSVAGLVFFLWWARRMAAAERSAAQLWLLRLVAAVFAVITLSDVIGFGNLAAQVMDGAFRTSNIMIMGAVMIRLVRASLELGAAGLPAGRLALVRRNADSILKRAIIVANILIVLFVAAYLLVIWKRFALPSDALQAFFAFGVTVGQQRITIGLVVTAVLILYGAFVLSWTLQALLMENVLNRRQMDAGARLSITRLVHYALVTVGFLIALSALGFELKNVTIIGGALGVGIGFGMQAIVNNFVSGLIMLFERPIKVGDVIQLSDGQQGRVLNLGMRATTVQTFDRAEIVVPNGDLISNQVTNWTLGDRGMRLSIPVGVAYGSDVETVMRVLTTVATQNERVLKDPQPVVLFLTFGASSLDFELRVWISDFNDRRIIQSALICEIDRRFRDKGIEIPFPQQDLHLRSVDDSAAKGLTGKAPMPAEEANPK